MVRHQVLLGSPGWARGGAGRGGGGGGRLLLPALGDHAVAVAQWNVSVKLAGSGVPEAKRINPEAIREFLRLGAWWKFVVVDAGDVAEVLRLAERFAIPRERILLMPEGVRREEILERSPWVWEECKRYGFRFSPRLHILLRGPKRGV